MFAWPGFVYKYLILFYKFCAQFFKVFWISISLNYMLLGVLVSSIERIQLKNVKIGIFLSWSHIGQDSGFSNKIGRILTRSGGLDSLLTIQDENKVTH